MADDEVDAGVPAVVLREVEGRDVAAFFEHLQDTEARRMAAFTPEDPSDALTFAARWERIRSDPTMTARTIEVDGRVAGHVACFVRDDDLEVTYWLGREFWGRGIATRALSAFLDEVVGRPIHARAAEDNVGSRRVLEKCGFEACGRGRGFAHGRGEEIDELLLVRRR